MKKKLVIFLMTAVLLCCACAPKQTEAAAAATAAPAVTEAPAPQLDKNLVILYTNDIHCGVDQGGGYAGLSELKTSLAAAGNYVALVDAGDAVQGEPIGTVSKGTYIVDIMNKTGYDLAVPGNHEFDYGMEQFLALTKQASFPYISCNFTNLETDKTVFDAYRILEFSGVKVAFVGVCTPKTVTSSTPAYFQDGNGNYIYGFCQDETGAKLYDAVQKAVDSARGEGAQYVIAVGHCGIEQSCSPWMSTEIIAATSGIDAWIDGHSHSVVESESVKNKDGKGVVLTQTGTKLQNVGMLQISPLGGITAKLVNDGEVGALISDMQDRYAEQMQTVVAKSDVALTIVDPKTDVRIVRNAETNLGDLCADAYRVIGGADIGFMNGGGVRVSMEEGDITYEDIIKVMPFGNNLTVVEATGQEILDALEFGVKDVPGEFGGFLQVSGLTYEIDTKIPSPVKTDDNKMFVSVEGARRVQNVLVDGQPIDPAKTYTVASHDYLLKNAGDGYTIFQDNVVVKDMVMADNQMLITFITENLSGVIGQEYADPYGAGRIVAAK